MGDYLMNNYLRMVVLDPDSPADGLERLLRRYMYIPNVTDNIKDATDPTAIPIIAPVLSPLVLEESGS